MEPQVTKQEATKILRDKKKDMYVFLAFTLFVVLMLILFAIRPTVLTIIRVNAEINAKKQIYSQLQTKTGNLGLLQQSYNTIEGDVDDLKLVFPSRNDFSLILVNTREIAEDNGFSLESVGFNTYDSSLISDTEPILPITVLKPYTVNLTVKGSSSGLFKFMTDIEKLPDYPVIENVDFSNKADENGDYVYSFTLKIYSIEDPIFYQ